MRSRRSLAGLCTAALVMSNFSTVPAFAQDPPATGSTQQVLAAADNAVILAGQQVPLDSVDTDAAGGELTNADATVVISDGGVSIQLSEADSLTIAIDGAAQVIGTEQGAAVLPSELEGLAHKVEVVEGGTARILAVADETYSDSPVHEYSYSVTLPEGAEIVEFAEGTIGIVQPLSEAAAVAPADDAGLAAVLGDLTGVDPLDLSENEAPAEVVGADGDEVGAENVLVTVFQQPWAVDAEGTPLPTELSVEDGRIVQTVDTTAAVFPVVSDPLPIVGIVLGAAARALAPHVIRAFATQAIRVGAAATTRGGYATFARFKAAVGSPRAGYQWHHIVEQSTIRNRGFNALWIHNRNNLVQIPTAVHQRCVNSWMARNGVRAFGVSAARNQTMRSWVQGQSFSIQHRIGVALLRHCGVMI